MEANTFGKVDKGRYSDQVIQLMANQILKGSLAVGDRLPSEKALTEQFKVSRTVVREALRALEESGLVEVRKGPGGGAFITSSFHKPVSTALKNLITYGKVTIDDLFDVRSLIEPHIAFKAALQAKPKDLKSLNALIQESMSNTDDVALLKANNIRFHLLLSRAAGNLLFSIIMESIVEMVDEFSRSFADLSLGRKHLELHAELLGLIKERRAEEAKELISKDISVVREMLRNHVSNTSMALGHHPNMKNMMTKPKSSEL